MYERTQKLVVSYVSLHEYLAVLKRYLEYGGCVNIIRRVRLNKNRTDELFLAISSFFNIHMGFFVYIFCLNTISVCVLYVCMRYGPYVAVWYFNSSILVRKVHGMYV